MDTNYKNPNENYFNQPISVANLTTPQTPLNLPPTPQDTTNYQGVISSIPTIEQITNQIQAPSQAESTSQSLMDRILGATSKLGKKTQAQAQAETTAGLPQFQTQLTDINNQLQGLQKESLAIPLQIQQEAQGRGVTAGGVAPIQTARLRENAIKSLGLSSIAQTLQGNIANAQAQVDRAVALEFEPIEAELNTLKTAYEMNKDILERQDKKRADALNLQIQERSRLLEEQKADRRAVRDIGMKLAQFGVDTNTIQGILSSRNVDEAIAKAGSKLQDPTQIAELESLRLNQVLTKQKIRREAYELQLLQEYDGLSPEQYRKKLDEEQKAIANAKDEQEKNTLQAQALDDKIILLDSILKSSAIDSVVGPTPLTRATGGIGGVLLRGVVTLPIGGGGAFQGALDQLTGSSDALIRNTEKFIDQDFLDKLIEVKSKGATFGALTDREGDALRKAANSISGARIYRGEGKNEKVVGYNMSEKDFKREIKIIQDLAKKAKEKATGKTFDLSEQSFLDSAFETSTDPSIYFQ